MPDAKPDYIPEDLTINDQESMVELIVEKICGVENAIEEHDEADDDSGEFQMNKEFKIKNNQLFQISFQRAYSLINESFCTSNLILPNYTKDIVPPPPKV